MPPSNHTPATELPNASAVAELLTAGKVLGKPIEVTGMRPGVLVPKDYTFTPLPFADRAPLPDHVRQSVTFDDAASFTAYVKRWKLPETMLLAQLPPDGKDAKFRAIFDYHTGGQGEGPAAARCAHTAVYPCLLSQEWLSWSAIHGKGQAQKVFIDFIEANAPDVVAPNSAALMEMAINFESRTDVEFASKVDRVTGGRNLTFKETITQGGGGQMKVPDRLLLLLPVFEGGKTFEIEARLEWIARDGKLSVTVHLKRTVDTLRAALQDIRQEIEAATGCTVLNGVAAEVPGS